MAAAGTNAVLALDLGTTMLKVGLFALDGSPLALAAREQHLHRPAPGIAEQSPDHVWGTLADAVQEVVAARPDARVAAISTSGQRGTAIALGPDGAPLSELVVWMDTRGVPQLDRVRARISDAEYYTHAGHPLVSYTGISRVLWLSAQDFHGERPAIVGAPQTWVLRRLGAADLVVDRSTASFLFPLRFDGDAWDDELAGALSLSVELLPRLVGAVDVVGELSEEAGTDLGLPPGIPLVAGGGDGQCAGAGSGALGAGRIMINVGTAAGVQASLPAPMRDPDGVLNCAVHVVPGAWELEGHTQASGAVLAWFRDRLAGRPAVDYGELTTAAAGVAAGADGLLFLPTFNGTSAPTVNPQARGCLLGLTLRHGRDEILRALLEGVALELRSILDALVAAGAAADEVRLAGGAAHSSLWSQIHADVLGRPVHALEVPDAALVGAAMCGAVALRAHPGFEPAARAFVAERAVFEPSAPAADLYDSLFSTYRDTLAALAAAPTFGALDALAAGGTTRRVM